MSNVSTSKFVNIIPQLIVARGSGFELNGLLLTQNSTLPIGQVYRFESADAVGAYFGATSQEYAFALKYFQGYDGKTKIPAALLIANYILAPQAGWMRGSSVAYTINQFNTIADGNLSVVIGGAQYDLTGLDFSAVVTYSDIAAALQTAIRAAASGVPAVAQATVTYSSQFKAFTITAGASDETGTVGYAVPSTGTGTDLSAILGFTQATGAIISAVQDSTITLSFFMNNIVKQTKNWITFTKLWAFSFEEDMAFSSWAASIATRYAYIGNSLESTAKDGNNDVDFASQLKANDIINTIPNFGDYFLAAFVMGAIASINFNIPDGKMTLAFKTQSGQAITCDNDDDYEVLTGKGYNVYVSDSTANNVFTGYQRGTITGDYGFIDAFVNHIWINDQLQVALRTLLSDRRFIPYSDRGLSDIMNAMKPVIDLAKQAGVIEEGVELSDDIINAVRSETGVQDVDSPLYTQGWYLYASQPSSAVRAQRGSPILMFYYCDGGSIQKIDLLSTAIR